MPVPTSKLVYRNFKRRLKGCCVCNKTVTQHNMLKPTDKSGRGLQSGARRGPGPYSKLMPQSESAVKGYLPRCPSVSRCFLWLYLTPPARKRRNEGAPRAPNEQPASRFSRAKCCNESILPAANSKQLWRTQTSTLTCSRKLHHGLRTTCLLLFGNTTVALSKGAAISRTNSARISGTACWQCRFTMDETFVFHLPAETCCLVSWNIIINLRSPKRSDKHDFFVPCLAWNKLTALQV